MTWSGLKHEIESRFADAVRGKVHLYSTRYGQPGRKSMDGRGWITYRGEEVASFDTALSRQNFGAYYHEATRTPYKGHPAVAGEERMPGRTVEPGEFSRFDLHESCWTMLDLPIDEALTSENPLIRALAVLDRRVGKRRLRSFIGADHHPLVQRLLDIRLREEGIALPHAG